MVANSFNQAYSPWLYKKLSNKEYEPVVALSTAVAILFVVGIIVYTVLAIYLIDWIVGEKFLQAALFLPWIAVGIAAICIYFMVVNPIFFIEKTGYLSIVTLIGGVSYLTFGWFAAKYYQEFGLALTYSLVEIIQTIVIFKLSNRVFPLPWFSLQSHINGWKNLLKKDKYFEN